MTKAYLLIATLLITHKAWASNPDFRKRLQTAITKYSEEADQATRAQIRDALKSLIERSDQNNQEEPSGEIFETLKDFKLASEEGRVYQEILEVSKKLKRLGIGMDANGEPLTYCYYLSTDD